MRHVTSQPSPAPVRRRAAAIAALVAATTATGMAASGAAPLPAATAAAPATVASAGSADSRAGTPERGSGLAQYVDAAATRGSEARAGALGNHNLLIQPVYWGESAPADLDNAAIGGQVQDTSAYFRSATASKITASLVQVRPWAKVTLTADEAASCDTAAIERAARAVAPDTPGSRQHLQVVFPQTSACNFGALSSRGLTAAGDGISFFNGPELMNWATMSFGLGSNAGLGMSNAVDCWDNAAHDNPVPLSTYCKLVPGGDPWDLMGWWPYGKVGALSAANLRRLGVLSQSEFPDVTPGVTTYPFLRPLSAFTGQRGVSVTIGTTRYTLEYRTPEGLDSWIDDATWTGPDGQTRTDPGGGVVVRMQDLASSTPADSMVLDFHPDGVAGGTKRHPGLEAGESWSSPGDVVRFTVASATASGASVKVEFPAMAKVERWAGRDRYGASAAISAKTYPAGSPVAYIASGEVYSDALSGAPVAGKDKGPVLLVSRDQIPGAIQTELRRLGAGKIVVLGGPASVSEDVEAKLAGYTAGGVTRIAGPDRFTTSAAISARSFTPGVATAYVASGRVYTDALSGAPVAGKNANPVLLVDSASIPTAIQAELRRLQPKRIVLFGGPSTVSEAVATQLQSFTSGPVTRWSGDDRFSTSAAIARANYGPGVNVLYVASGRVFPDALSGAPVAGLTRGPVLLVDSNTLPAVVASEIDRLQPKRIVVLGGPATVSESVRAVLGAYLP